jgi:hypothetical protein
MDDVLSFCKDLPLSERTAQLIEFIHSEMDRRGIESLEESESEEEEEEEQ